MRLSTSISLALIGSSLILSGCGGRKVPCTIATDVEPSTAVRCSGSRSGGGSGGTHYYYHWYSPHSWWWGSGGGGAG